MNYNQVLQYIVQWIYENHANKITGNILQDVLIEMLNYIKETDDNFDIDIQNLQNQIDNITISQNLNVFEGTDNPNINPPVDPYDSPDIYVKTDTNDLFIFSGSEWVQLTNQPEINSVLTELRIDNLGADTDTAVANYINNLTPPYNKNGNENIVITLYENDEQVKTFWLVGSGKGLYGAGQNQISVNNLVSFVGNGSGGGGIPDAPSDGKIYGRKDEDWEEVKEFQGIQTSDTSDIELSGDGTVGDPLEAELTQDVKNEIAGKEDVSNKVQDLNNPNSTTYPSTQAIADLDLDDFKNESLDRYTRLSDLEDDEKINVKHFGAKGDGVADDTQAIQNAFLEAKNSDVKRVFFPAGNYKISNTIFVASGIWAYGMSKFSTRVFLEVDDINDLPIITPIQFSGLQEKRRWRGMFVSETADEQHEEFTEDILITDMTIDWNGQDCGKVNSICPIIFGKTKNSWVQRVKIADALPNDLSDGTRMLCFSILFFISEDCGISNSHIGASDYESVSVKYISKRTKVLDNVFEIDKPNEFVRQAHAMQVASEPDTVGVHLKAKYGDDLARNTFLEGNTFLMKRNVAHCATSHTSTGWEVNGNFVKFYDTLDGCHGFKPFAKTENFATKGNIFDLTEYKLDPLSTPLLMAGTDVANPRVANGVISYNQIYAKSSKSFNVYKSDFPMIGGTYGSHQNIQIFSNNVYISGETQENRSIFGITGINNQITNNNVYLENQAETITEDDLVFASSKGGLQTKISGNQVFGKIAKGVRLDDDSGNYRNFEVKDNQWDAIEDITKDNKDDAEIILDDVKKREGFTEIQLNNIIGHRYNFDTPLDADTYTFKHAKIGGKAEILINAEDEPVLIGGTKRNNGTAFAPDTDMIMHIEVRDKDKIRYWFELFSDEAVVWVDDVTENTAKVYFLGIEPQASYDVYLNGSLYATISESGDEITGLNIGTVYSLQIDTNEGLTDAISFKTVEAEFYSIWDTTKEGISDNDQIALPLKSSGAYDFQVRYNGKVIKTVNSYTDNIITFPDGGGIKEINIVGTVNGFGWSADANGDNAKILEIVQFGKNFSDANTGSGWMINTSNLTSIAEDTENIILSSGYQAFRNTGIVKLPFFNSVVSGSCQEMFRNAKDLEVIEVFDTSLGTNFNSFLRETRVSEIGDFDFSNGTIFNYAFRVSVPITEFLPRRFDKLSNGTNMFQLTSIPTEAWSEILINLEAYNTNDDVQIHGGNSKYNSSAVSARNALIARGWTITDGGQE